jgi:hypothetical protein
MFRTITFVAAATMYAAAVSVAEAGVRAVPINLGTVATPFGSEGLLALAAAGVIGGVWLARRKR